MFKDIFGFKRKKSNSPDSSDDLQHRKSSLTTMIKESFLSQSQQRVEMGSSTPPKNTNSIVKETFEELTIESDDYQNDLAAYQHERQAKLRAKSEDALSTLPMKSAIGNTSPSRPIKSTLLRSERRHNSESNLAMFVASNPGVVGQCTNCGHRFYHSTAARTTLTLKQDDSDTESECGSLQSVSSHNYTESNYYCSKDCKVSAQYRQYYNRSHYIHVKKRILVHPF